MIHDIFIAFASFFLLVLLASCNLPYICKLLSYFLFLLIPETQHNETLGGHELSNNAPSSLMDEAMQGSDMSSIYWSLPAYGYYVPLGH